MHPVQSLDRGTNRSAQTLLRPGTDAIPTKSFRHRVPGSNPNSIYPMIRASQHPVATQVVVHRPSERVRHRRVG